MKSLISWGTVSVWRRALLSVVSWFVGWLVGWLVSQSVSQSVSYLGKWGADVQPTARWPTMLPTIEFRQRTGKECVNMIWQVSRVLFFVSKRYFSSLSLVMNKLRVCYRHLICSLKSVIVLWYGECIRETKSCWWKQCVTCRWTEGYFLCINPYGSTVDSNSTTLSVLGRVSSLNRQITLQCFMFVFAEFLLPSGCCYWTLKITVSWKINLDQIAGDHKNNLNWKVLMGQLFPSSVKKISLFKSMQYLETQHNKASTFTIDMWGHLRRDAVP